NPSAGGDQRQHRVGRRRRGEGDATLRGGAAKRLQWVAPGVVEQSQGVVVAPLLRRAGGPALGGYLVGVGGGGADPPLDEELAQPRRGGAVLELVGEHRRNGHRQPLGEL